MKLSEFKNRLENTSELEFYLPNGSKIPSHFHITEVGITTKQFTDCGNTFRISKNATLQLWTSVDFDHRLEPQKVIQIIDSTQSLFNNEDLDVEIEYQQETIGKYGLEFIENKFVMLNTKTDCLAKYNCGIVEKVKVKLSELSTQSTRCSPESNCC